MKIPKKALSFWQSNQTFTLFCILFGLFFVRFIYYGPTYFHALDDYIQHHNYAAGSMGLGELIVSMGLLSARPLAGLMDVTLWSVLFPVMIVGVAIISVLYTASALLFHRLARRYFGVGSVFLVIYALLPLSFEGVYWMSASTRIVPGLFFGAFAATCFDHYCRTGIKQSLWLFLLSQTLCFGFYEQSILLSLTLTALLGLYHLVNREYRGFSALLSAVPCVVFILVTTLAPSADIFTQRSHIILPAEGYYFDVFLPEVLQQMKSAFLGGGFYTLFTGFLRGAQMILHDGAIIYFVCVVALCLLFYFRLHGDKPAKKSAPLVLGMFVGVLLTLAPIAPFFILENPWFSLRGTVTALVGIALLCDCFARLVVRWVPALHPLVHGGACALALLCCIASVSELHDYRMTNQADHMAADTIIANVPADGSLSTVGILGLEQGYLTEQNFKYHEHLHGCTESDWAFSGLIRSKDAFPDTMFVPLPITTPAYYRYNRDSHQPDQFDALYYYSHAAQTLTPVSYAIQPDGSYLFLDMSGAPVLQLTDVDGTGHLTQLK